MDDQKNSTLAGTLSEGDYSEKKANRRHSKLGTPKEAVRTEGFRSFGSLEQFNVPVKFGDFFPGHQDATALPSGL